jgi:cytosine/adenosine deaminase-related metal-dependent hydrolase
MHCAEAPKDLVIYRESYDCSPVEFCYRTNLIGKDRMTVLAHMVNLDLKKDLPLLRETGASVANNASSNCKLGSGIAAVPAMLEENINVSLGTDGAPCANTYDMIQEMRVAALVQKGSRQDATAVTAEQVLTMATINGAKALGLEKEIGSLEVGKKADFVVLDPSGLHCVPFDPQQVLEGGIDPVTTVVFSCSGADVDKVVVDGEVLVDGRRLVKCDEKQIREEAQRTIKRIRHKSEVRSEIKRNYC